MDELERPSLCCPNEGCELYGNFEQAQIIRFGKTKNGSQRYRCKRCRGTFTDSRGTLFYRRRTPPRTLMEMLARVAMGERIAHITSDTGIKEDTILAWLRNATRYTEAVEDALVRDYHLTREELDWLWEYVGRVW